MRVKRAKTDVTAMDRICMELKIFSAHNTIIRRWPYVTDAVLLVMHVMTDCTTLDSVQIRHFDEREPTEQLFQDPPQ